MQPTFVAVSGTVGVGLYSSAIVQQYHGCFGAVAERGAMQRAVPFVDAVYVTALRYEILSARNAAAKRR